MAEIQNLRKTTIVLTGIILEILKSYMAQDDHWKYVWVPATDKRKVMDKVNSKIVIEPAYLFSPDVCNNRPGVYVKRGNLVFGPRVGMDDIYSVNPVTGGVKYAINANIEWGINCISKSPGEAEMLAMEVSEVLICFAPIIRRDFKFDRFGVSAIGAVGLSEEYKEFFLVPIQIQGSYNEVWQITPEALPIQGIYNNINFDGCC
jgi:hypothetical protein